MRVRNAMLSSATAWIVGVWLLAVFSQTRAVDAADRALRPNIVLIVADDLGYGDVGCYGQRVIKTPNIDRLAAAGMRFTDCYAGSTVCAPSRCVLMTGRHTGHARIRGNGLTPLAPDDVTVAEVLKSAGYATGMFGKWGLGEPDTTGVPNKQGFDEWFGYLNQHHAHNYYPDYLWKNDRKVTFDNVVENNVATRRVAYSADLLTREALDFLDRHRADHFFLYLPFTLPHANNEAGQQGMEVPSDAPYTHESWPQPQKNHGAMITYLDAQVGKVLARLSELKLDDDTIVFFNDSDRFDYARPPGQVDPRSGVICFPNNFDYGGAQLPEGLFRVTCLANYDEWAQLPEEAYQADKLRWFAEVQRSARRFLPAVADSVELKQLPGSDLMTVPVEINDKSKQFLLDIGTNPTEVSEAAAAELALPEHEKLR